MVARVRFNVVCDKARATSYGDRVHSIHQPWTRPAITDVSNLAILKSMRTMAKYPSGKGSKVGPIRSNEGVSHFTKGYAESSELY